MLEKFFYQVTQPIVLPPSLKPHQWKRFHEIENIKPILHDSTDCPDLFANNQHLLHSEFIKWFCSTLKVLNYCHEVGGKKWQGWHHIYSPNKLRKESQHNPQINPDGKYIVRLFFMGFWRCFAVDDAIPFDKENIPLLPCTQNVNELWPMLLAKALWQIASISSIDHHEIVDFNTFLCFTGWPYLSQNITHLSPKDRWQLLIKYAPNYNQPQSTISTIQNNQLDTVNEIPEDKGKMKRNSKRKRTISKIKEVEIKEIKPTNVKGKSPTLTLLYFHEIHHDKVSILPSGYPLYIESTSDLPSDPTQVKPPLESWKLPRWISWAVRQGIIDPKECLSPIRRILILAPSEVSKTNAEWLDFNDFNGYPMHLHLLFKSEYFKCSRHVSNITDDQQKEKIDVKTNKRRVSKAKISDDDLTNKTHLHNLKSSRNEPLYLFVDSVESKFFLFNYSVYDENDWSYSLIIEKACWFRQNENANLLKIQTKGCASRVLCLSPGRHLLKIFCQSSAYYLTISSDKIFHIGGREEIHDLMTFESEMTKLFANHVRCKLETAFHSFGSPDYLMNLRYYYQCYMPEGNHEISKQNRRLIHDYFKAEVLDVIENKCKDNVYFHMRRALKIFFIDPEMKRQSSLPDDDNSGLLTALATTSSHEIGMENTVIKIQCLFRMVIIKKYLEIHESNHREHNAIRETLQEILQLFDEDTMCHLVRNFINRNVDFKQFYPCSFDFDKVLQIQKMKGTASITSSKWIPIVRQNLIVPEKKIVFASLDLFIDLPSHTLRSFDNDTTREVQRLVNNVMPFHYRSNKGGFSVLGYGRTDQKKLTEVEWTLHLTTIKGSPQFHKSELTNPGIYELSNIYIPNSDNYFAKAIVKVSNSCTVSMRLHTSYPKTKIKLIISNDKSEVLHEVSGNSVVILPVVNLLDCEGEYLIHAVVLDDSWPLTETEWQCVEKKKKDIEKMISMRKASNISTGNFMKDKIKLTTSDSLESPYWSLQILSDPGINVELYEDTTREVEIYQKKMLWKSQDPSRLERGRNLQEEFREENCIQSHNLELHEYEDIEIDEEIIAEEIRTLSSPLDNRRLPSLNLSQYLDVSDMSTTSQEQMEIKIHRDNLLKFKEKSVHLMQHLELMMINSLRV